MRDFLPPAREALFGAWRVSRLSVRSVIIRLGSLSTRAFYRAETLIGKEALQLIMPHKFTRISTFVSDLRIAI